MSKMPKSIKQLHSKRWSKTADSLTILTLLSGKFETSICSAVLVKKMAVIFDIENNSAVTTRTSM